MFGSAPVAEYPATLDLGVHELGEEVVGHFSISNSGDADLVISNVHSNCSCTGMEQERDGRYYRVESLRVKSKESLPLVMRVSVRGVPVGTAMINVVSFETNDPTQPECRIEASVSRVTGGVSATPGSLVIGSVPIGREVRHVIEVRDTAEVPRRLARVNSSDPGRVQARLLPADGPAATAPRNEAGALIARVEVTVATETPGEFRAKVEMELAGEDRKPDAVDVMGRVAPPVELMPTLLALPRTSDGTLVYSGQCLCRSSGGEELRLTVDPPPAGLAVELVPQQQADRQVVRVTLAQNPPADVSKKKQLIRIRAAVAGRETLLSLPVLIRQ